MKSLLPSIVAIIAFIVYVIWMKEGPHIGLESLGKFFKASFTCWPFIFVFGLLSMILGYREAKEKKYVLIWVIPVSLIFAVPILIILWWILGTFMAANNILIK